MTTHEDVVIFIPGKVSWVRATRPDERSYLNYVPTTVAGA